jgi:hypothetical protein
MCDNSKGARGGLVTALSFNRAGGAPPGRRLCGKPIPRIRPVKVPANGVVASALLPFVISLAPGYQLVHIRHLIYNRVNLSEFRLTGIRFGSPAYPAANDVNTHRSNTTTQRFVSGRTPATAGELSGSLKLEDRHEYST